MSAGVGRNSGKEYSNKNLRFEGYLEEEEEEAEGIERRHSNEVNVFVTEYLESDQRLGMAEKSVCLFALVACSLDVCVLAGCVVRDSCVFVACPLVVCELDG